MSEYVNNTTSTRGGMSKNPFAGYERLDKCDLQGPSIIGNKLIDVVSNVSGERTLITESFKDVLNNYLFFGLGQNGTSVEEFWSSVEFLFNVRSYFPETWNKDRVITDVYFDEVKKKRVIQEITLTDEQLKCMCADKMWGILKTPMSFNIFIEKIKKLRLKIIRDNYDQITGYIQSLYEKSAEKTVTENQTVGFQIYDKEDIESVLVYPKNPEELIKLVFCIPKDSKISKKYKSRYKKLISIEPKDSKSFDENIITLKPIIGALFNFNEFNEDIY